MAERSRLPSGGRVQPSIDRQYVEMLRGITDEVNTYHSVRDTPPAHIQDTPSYNHPMLNIHNGVAQGLQPQPAPPRRRASHPLQPYSGTYYTDNRQQSANSLSVRPQSTLNGFHSPYLSSSPSNGGTLACTPAMASPIQAGAINGTLNDPMNSTMNVNSTMHRNRNEPVNRNANGHPPRIIHPPPMSFMAPAMPAVVYLSQQEMAAQSDVHRVRELVMQKSTLVPMLNTVLKSAGLGTTGRKPEKQERIISAALRLETQGSYSRLTQLRSTVEGAVRTTYTEAVNNLGTPPPFSATPTSSTNSFRGVMGSTYGTGMGGMQLGTAGNVPENPIGDRAPVNYRRLKAHARNPLLFKPSPFYCLDRMVGTPEYFMKPHPRIVQRDLVFQFPPETLNSTDTRLFLVGQEYLGPQNREEQPMYFPFYFEIELDGRALKASTRGVRGMAGSAKPVDLKQAILDRLGDRQPDEVKRVLGQQHMLKLVAHISDTAEQTSTKSFGFMLITGKMTAWEELVAQLQRREHIPFDKTKAAAMEAAAGNGDDDVVAESDTVYSLKDPVMMTRITVPVRSHTCQHIDCFDASTYVQLQAQAETWKCPVCNKPVTWKSLAVDDYFSQILELAGPRVESVTIGADGSWTFENGDDGDEESTDDEVVDLISDDEPEQKKEQGASDVSTVPEISSALRALKAQRNLLFNDDDEEEDDVVDLTND